MVHILEFSDEILLHIFSFLDNYDIHATVALICKKFRNLSMDPSLILNITITPHMLYIGKSKKLDISSPTQMRVLELLRSFYNLQSLTLSRRTDLDIIIEIALKYCPKLHFIEIMDNDENFREINAATLISLYIWSEFQEINSRQV